MNNHRLPGIFNVTAFIVLTCLLQPDVMAETRLSIRDNTTPAASFYSPSAINSTPFNPGTEWRFVAPDGLIVHHDLINGSEVWNFDDDTHELTEVTGAERTLGSYDTDSACPFPAGCEGLTQTNSFLSFDLGIVAPTADSDAGRTYGVASTILELIGTFPLRIIDFPIVEMQWRDQTVYMGRSTGSVTFFCPPLSLPDETCQAHRCMMEHTIGPSENSTFQGFTIQMEFPIVQVEPCG